MPYVFKLIWFKKWGNHDKLNPYHWYPQKQGQSIEWSTKEKTQEPNTIQTCDELLYLKFGKNLLPLKCFHLLKKNIYKQGSVQQSMKTLGKNNQIWFLNSELNPPTWLQLHTDCKVGGNLNLLADWLTLIFQTFPATSKPS